MLELKHVLTGIGQKQADLARELSLSPAALSQIVNHDQWPKSMDKKDLQGKITGWLANQGADQITINDAFKVAELPPTAPHTPKKKQSTEDEGMLLQKQSFTQQARQHFGLKRDPFAEPETQDEIYLTHDARVVREAMRAAARRSHFIAVIGESGSGKSTLRESLVDWIEKEQLSTTVIEPYVLGMEDNDIKGKTLKARTIAEAMMAEISPNEGHKRSQDAFYRQLHRTLQESQRAGNHHLLIIEEAQGLSLPTLKHLKRFFELKDGLTKLLSIVLIGQTELDQKLDEKKPEIREVVQRCEKVHLKPLDDELENYLHHRFGLAGIPLPDVMEDSAIAALRRKLSNSKRSLLYPLAVHNVVTKAMNDAAAIGSPTVDADLIMEV